jgi:hypothetical protein
MSVTVIFLSAGCFWFAYNRMNGYQDCRLDEPFFHHTIPAEPLPDNCASGLRMLSAKLAEYFGFGILFLLLVPFFINWRETRREKMPADKIFHPGVKNN